MKFNPTKTPAVIVKEGAFGGISFRDIYSGVNETWYKNSQKEFEELKKIGQKYSTDYYDVKLNKYKDKTGTLLRF